MGLQSEKIKQMASEYAEKVSIAASTLRPADADLHHMTGVLFLAAVGDVVRGAFRQVRPAAAAPQSRGFSGETDPATEAAAGGGQLTRLILDQLLTFTDGIQVPPEPDTLQIRVYSV